MLARAATQVVQAKTRIPRFVRDDKTLFGPRYPARTKLTNNGPRGTLFPHATLILLGILAPHILAVETNNFRRLLRTVEALSELGPELTAEREFADTSRRMLAAVMEAAGAREGALFVFNEKPTMLTSVAAEGFAMLPEPAFIPLLPKHAHALTAARGPIVLNASTYSIFLSSNGNVAPELFKCVAPLKASGKLAGVVALGQRPGTRLTKTRNSMPWICYAATLGWPCRITP